jgi:hypothetical protein
MGEEPDGWAGEEPAATLTIRRAVVGGDVVPAPECVVVVRLVGWGERAARPRPREWRALRPGEGSARRLVVARLGPAGPVVVVEAFGRVVDVVGPVAKVLGGRLVVVVGRTVAGMRAVVVVVGAVVVGAVVVGPVVGGAVLVTGRVVVVVEAVVVGGGVVPARTSAGVKVGALVLPKTQASMLPGGGW